VTIYDRLSNEYDAAKAALADFRVAENNGTARRGQHRRVRKLADKIEKAQSIMFCSHVWNRTSPELRAIVLYAYKQTRGLRGLQRELAMRERIGGIADSDIVINAVVHVLVANGPKMCKSLEE
jgi:hypothetical protein